jgi:hypothetical protein
MSATREPVGIYATLTQVTDGHDHLSGVAAQAVNSNDNDGIALRGVVQECSKTGRC